MPESVVGQAYNTIKNLKNGNDGDLQLKNGRLYLTGAATYTTIGTVDYYPEAVRDNNSEPLRRAKNTTGTGNLYLNNGYIYASGLGQITLVD